MDRADSADSQTPDGRPNPPETPTRSISKDDAFHILQNARRRAVLRYLLASDGRDPVEMGTLTEAVAAWEYDTTVGQLSSEQRQRVYIGLYQAHLPKLDNSGVIDYDRQRGTVVSTPLIQVLEPYLDEGFGPDADVGTDGEVDRDSAEESRAQPGVVDALSSVFTP